MKNKTGAFVTPSLESVTAAASAFAETMPEDFRVSITDAPGASAYPISGMTWLLVYEKQKDVEKGKKLVRFLDWMMHDGQQQAPALHYAPLPAQVIAKETVALRMVTGQDGTPLAGR